MITHLGKTLRIIRINSGDNMRDMADKLGLSVSYLSAIENAKRNIPVGFEEKILDAYHLSEEEKKSLHEDIELSTDQVKVKMSDLDERQKKILKFL